MTPGHLLDLLIINEVRKEKLASELEIEVKHDLNKQNGFYLREIGRYFLEISDGKRPGKFAKHKNYDKNIGIVQFYLTYSFIFVISFLEEHLLSRVKKNNLENNFSIN